MEIELPQVGESVTQGVLGKWLVRVGDRVERYAPLVEVVTDKVNMEMPSPVSGVVKSILAQEGQTVPMGTVIAEIEVKGGEQVARNNAETPAAPSPLSPTAVDRVGTLMADAAPVGPTGSGGPISAGVTDGAAQALARYSPAVQRLAAEHGVDLALVEGTGLNGRVTRNDVRVYVAARDGDVGVGVPGAEVPGADQPERSRPLAPDEERVPLTPTRRIIADNMVRSATEVPQAWSMVEADVTGMVRLRQRAREELRRRDGVNLTYLAFVLKAVADSLKENPLVNSSWGGDAIVLKRRINLGVATAAPEGLVVPVIHDADYLSIPALAAAVEDLAARARESKLTLPDVQGGTFTVNNTGALGSVIGKPLISPPQVAIMNTEAIVKRPVVVDDAIAIRSIMNLCLTFDHRVLDGAEASAFLAAVKGRLEDILPDMAV